MTPVLLSNLSNILESVLIPIPVILELESPILESRIPLWGIECGLEFKILDLNLLPEQILTPETLLNFSYFPESNVVHALPDFRSIIPSFHIPFWAKGADNNGSEISLKIWKLDGVKFLIKIIHIYIILVGYIRVVSSGFLRTPRKLDWAAFCGPIRPPP